jgi:hypothetical protein
MKLPLLAMLMLSTAALADEITCETRGEYTHCWDRYGNTVSTTWIHNGRSTTWTSRPPAWAMPTQTNKPLQSPPEPAR